ncbi:hypothetical protein FB45DRAFT_921219 [Roridomyces roridus]|uniref:BTB domain-containing protein n=1 Tax=Roridomyces roridus TaxID=1738132 RepID=A0AAD7BQ79_9AGAR|nr:hypothetical protein FB45DRAFT_921219 [Roridomyces roridus]
MENCSHLLGATTPLTRSYSTELHFSDGNLILQADQTCFRVYGGFLADRSPVFRDMLSFPQPPDAELMDGVPLVHVPDSAKDLNVFLKAMFLYEFFPPFPARTDFPTVSSILRLSSKYQTEELYKRALVHFSSAFPMDLSEVTRFPSWELDNTLLIPVIVLARDMGINWVLPYAMYKACSRLNTKQLLRGVSLPRDKSHAHDDQTEETRYQLHPDDALQCLEQTLAFVTAAAADLLEFLWVPEIIPGCTRHVACRANRLSLRRETEAWRSHHHVALLNLVDDHDWSDLAVCHACMGVMHAQYERALQTFWASLPGRFGLPEWSVLRAMKNEATK